MTRSPRGLSALLAVGSVLFAPAALAVASPAGGDVSAFLPLDFRPVDVEYSDTLDQLVCLSSTPTDSLVIYDPLQSTSVSIALPLAASCVSVSPDGTQAAVGHDGWMTQIDLITGQVMQTLPVTTDVLDIVLAGNGFAYCFPRFGQWERIRCIELATGIETPHVGWSVYSGTVARLHPSGDRIYGANNGLSPSDIERYDIGGGTAQLVYDSPYHGDFAMCGDVWLSEDGFRIFTRCGNVFRASNQQAEDMTYNGNLSGQSPIGFVHHSSEAGLIASVEETQSFGGGDDREVVLFDDDFLSESETIDLPQVQLGGASFDTHGKFVFFDAEGSRLFIVAAVDASSGLILDHGVFTYDVGDDCTGEVQDVCAGEPNSTGVAASLSLSGSLSVSSDDAVLQSSGCPANTFASFLFSSESTYLPLGDGFLCVSPFAIGGLKRPWGIAFTDAQGSVSQPIGFSSLPASAAIPVGSTQVFQLWYRDGAGQELSNLSGAIRATFCQ